MGCTHQIPSPKAQESLREMGKKDCKSQRRWIAYRKQYFPGTQEITVIMIADRTFNMSR